VKKANRAAFSTNRLIFMLTAIITAFFLLIWKVIYIQAVNPEFFIEKSDLNLIQKKVIPAKRGEIEDRDGEKLAVTLFYKKICAKPSLLNNKEKVVNVLSDELGINQDDIRKKLDENDSYVVLAEKVPVEKADEIRNKIGEDFVWLEYDYLRMYPYDSLASHVIGFVGLKSDDKNGQPAGREGLEYYYDKLLSGEPGYIVAQFYSSDLAVVPYTVLDKKDAIDGKNLVITLDKDIQFYVEDALKQAIEEHRAKAGAAIVMDSATGEIYAMASYPTFNLNQYFKVRDENAFINRCVRAVYEPGSTFKSITIAGCIEENLAAPSTRLYLPSQIKIGRYTIGEAHKRAAGVYTVAEILKESMNIGAVRLAEKLGAERFYEYGIAFGFGQKTGVDISGEQEGRFPSPEEWKKTTLANLSFGQGLSCTPLQMLVATNVFANGGKIVRPHLMRYSYDPKTGLKQKWAGEKPVRIISEKTASVMKDLLIRVVDEGTGIKAKVWGYKVAGKTGTAQVPGKSGYEKGKYISSFVGFFPASKPKFSIIVVIYEPHNQHYGGLVAAPVFSKIAAFAAKHYGIVPDEGNNEKYRNTSDLKIGD
jgi:cell division protein FtsI (penicillin-binding protein 3)